MSGYQSPKDDFIREKLSSNLEAYTNNTLLNKLTPSRNQSVGKDNNSSSNRKRNVRRSSRSGTNSQRVTPDWDKRYPRRNDSNIVTSPVKTMKNYNNDSVDYKSSNNNTQHSNQLHDGTTIKQPLKSSPKKPLRKGTPLIKHKNGSQKDEDYKDEDEEDIDDKEYKGSPRRKQNGKPSSIKKTPRSEPKSTNPNSSSRKIITNSRTNYSLITRDQNNYINDNDIIEDDYIGSHHPSNNTLLSEIPSDILSPEKHIYPTENLRKSSSNLSSAKKKPITNETLIPDLYPKISPSRLSRKSPSKSKSNHSPSKSPLRQNSSIYVNSTNAEVEEYDDEEEKGREDTPLSNPISQHLNSTFIRRSSPFNQPHLNKSKLPIPIHSDHSFHKSPDINTSRSSRHTTTNIFDGISLKDKPTKAHQSDTNESFRHLNEFIRNPLIDDDRYSTTSNHLDIEAERKAYELREQARRASRSPQNKNGLTNTTITKNNNHEDNTISTTTTNKNNDVNIYKDNPTNNTNNTDNDNNDIPRQLDFSRFESSDEEPAPPELTVPLTEEPLYKSSAKRRNEFIETSTIDKRLKKTPLYPTLPYQSPTKRGEIIEEPELKLTKPTELKTPLYPTLPSLTKENLKQNDENNEDEDVLGTNLKAQNLNNSFSNIINDVSNNIFSDLKESKDNDKSNTAVSKSNIPRSIPQTKLPQPQPQPKTQPTPQDKPAGGPNDWNRNQWKSFLTAFKIYKSRHNMGIFNQRLLDYLKCDRHEIQLKIQFFLNHEDEFKK